MKIFLAGGAGYIGSHTAVALLEAGYEVVIVDNYYNSSPEAVVRVEAITGKKVVHYEADIKDKTTINAIMQQEKPDCVIHFAGLKAVGESVQKPLEYYRNNIDTTLTLLECMQENSVNNIVFSSSATVYGDNEKVPYVESYGRGRCSNPYGWTKAMMEQILEDVALADNKLSVVLLRYFNPIGAHESGMIGEDPNGVPNNLMPFVAQVAIGRREKLTVFGGDYPTEDGTCLRDYIHIMDLAEGHVKAIEYAVEKKGCEIINLGTGTPYSVLDLINTFEQTNGLKLNYEIGPRRAGDLPKVWSNADKAKRLLNWEAKRSLADMCRDTWRWQKKNPMGYQNNKEVKV